MTGYNNKYFEERDLLIPHLAENVKTIAKKYKLKTVLDVGCGTGKLVQYLAKEGLDIKGCDNSITAVAAARQLNPRSIVVKASATKLPYAKESFDLVCAISVIEHLTEAQADKFLKETVRVLKPRAFVFLVTPNFATPIRKIQGKKWFGYSDPTHVNFFTPKSLQKLLEKHQFGSFKLTFPINYHSSLDWEFPPPLVNLPRSIKRFLIYLLFTSPFFTIRNSLWILAQKK